MSGLFVAFEGIDGCGKSTQLACAAKRLEDEGHPVVTTREPGGTAIAEKIRAILIDPTHREMHNECELLLYLAARAQHVREKIKPALEKGAIVLCDRFQLATFAYQGFGRSIPLSLLKTMNEFATGGLTPDVTFIFDISVEASFNRMKAMNKRPDRLELSGADFFSRISQGYRALAQQDPLKTALLDGDQPVDAIAKTVWERIHAAMAGSGAEKS
jgi:dTMP kinase